MGVPVSGKNFSRQHQGPPTWYEIRVTHEGYVARAGQTDIMVAMNAETYARDVKEVAPGGYLIFDSTWPRPALLKREDITAIGVPLARLCNENFNGVRTRILMKNICYAGVLAALLDLDLERIRELLAETYAKKPQLVESNMKAIQLGYDYARANFSCPLPLHVAPLTQTAGHIMIDGNTAAALGCIYAGATVAAWYPITPSTSLMDAFKMFGAFERPEDRRSSIASSGRGRARGDRHRARRVMERRACVHADERPGPVADERVLGSRTLRSCRSRVRRPASRSVDRCRRARNRPISSPPSRRTAGTKHVCFSERPARVLRGPIRRSTR
jgi:Pyruvate/2-oxoacid:ferredoxin oxidoreductase gamma subunit